MAPPSKTTSTSRWTPNKWGQIRRALHAEVGPDQVSTPSHTADVVADALAAKIIELPTQLRRSLTWDQGKEMAQHARFSVETGLPVYFCDPKSPWQRGSNENTNGLLRQYFPKRSDLRPFSQEDLDVVAAELNDRPRQTLGWRSPSRALDEAVAMTA